MTQLSCFSSKHPLNFVFPFLSWKLFYSSSLLPQTPQLLALFLSILPSCSCDWLSSLWPPTPGVRPGWPVNGVCATFLQTISWEWVATDASDTQQNLNRNQGYKIMGLWPAPSIFMMKLSSMEGSSLTSDPRYLVAFTLSSPRDRSVFAGPLAPDQTLC